MKLATAAEVAQQAKQDAAPAATPKPAPVSHDKLRVSAKLVALVTPFMATSDIRYYLNGISIRPHPAGGAVITATNGHVLGTAYDPSAVCEHDVILALTPATITALKARAGKGRELVLRNGRVTIIDGPEEISIQPGNPVIEAKYPDLSRVIPPADRLKPGLMGYYNTAYIAVIDRVSKIAGARHAADQAATFFTVDGNPNNSAVARLTAEPNFFAVLMPQRSSDEIASLPHWCATATPAKDELAPATAGAA